ncbi:CHAT domain-containing protein [Cellulomonas terrae]|uniref:CHAT domain-containing protein n=2 Tax=Cellulomonas terrae TaxID=311234 RepID=A0A511JFC9_9CELL|nr:CHAT domain-containing protein [Cellulomonas terrae]
MVPSAHVNEHSPPVGEAYSLPEGRDALLIHVQGLMESADLHPRAVAGQATDMVALARRLHDPELLGLSLRVLAWTFRALWDETSARRLLDEAVRISRKHTLAHVEASALVSRATVLQDMGRTAGAARDLDDALAAVDRASAMDPAERALLHGRIRLSRAVLDQNAGRLLAAEERYRSLLAEGELDVSRTVIATNNLAMLLAERGAFDEALQHADASVDLCEQAPGLLAPAIQTRAWIAVRAGRLREGMHDFEGAARAYSDAGIPLGEYYTEFADAMMDLRLLPEAATAARSAVHELEESGGSLMATEARLRLARIALLTGDVDGARHHADAAAEAARHQRRAGWRDRAVLVGVEARLEARSVGVAEVGTARRAAGRLERAGNLHSAVEAYLVAGRVALAVDRPRDAIATLVRAGDLARNGQVLVRLRGRLAVALAERAARRPAAALEECRSGLRDLAVHRSALPTIELRALASGHGAELGEIGLGVVLAGGSPARALAWMERTRAAALLTRFPASQVPMAQRRAGSVAGSTGPGRGVVVADTAPRVSADDWSRRVRASEGSGVPHFRGLAALREALDGRTLVELGKFEGRLVAVVVEPRHARLVELGAEEDVVTELRPLLFALRRLANPRGVAAAEAARASAELRIARLRALLMAPLGVGEHDELVVVPVGMLHGVPWSCLHDGPLAQAPSATFWVRTRAAARAREGAGRTVLVAGPDLTGASEEVEALRDVHPGALVLASAGAGAEEVVAALADADLAHLACHGSPRADNPMFSSLLLADGPVTVQELHGAGVAPHRLVLASCHSGADVAYAGDEVLGFVSAMLAQGTAGVVASIAAVPDVAAVDLMLELHRGLRDGLPLARALHAARGRVDRSTPEGFVNWCTFSAHGAA